MIGGCINAYMYEYMGGRMDGWINGWGKIHNILQYTCTLLGNMHY